MAFHSNLSGNFHRVDDRLFFFSNGDYAYILPSGLVYKRILESEENSEPAIIKHEQYLICYDSDANLYLDLIAFSGIYFLAMLELIKERSFKSFTKVSGWKFELLTIEGLTDKIIEYKIHASKLKVLLEWMSGIGEMPLAPVDGKSFPDHFHFTIQFPEAEILFLGMSALFAGKRWREFNYNGGSLCPFIIRYKDSENQVKWLDDKLAPTQWKAFQESINQFPLTEMGIADRSDLDAFIIEGLATSEKVWENEQRSQPTETPLMTGNIEVLSDGFDIYKQAKAQLISLDAAAEMLTNLIGTYEFVQTGELSKEETISQLLNLKGLVLKAALMLDDALDALEQAFESAAPGTGKQDIAYNLGYVMLMQLSQTRTGLDMPEYYYFSYPENPDMHTFKFPIPAWPGTEKQLVKILSVFEEAADNTYKFSQVAMVHALLGGTVTSMPVPERISHLEKAINAYDLASNTTYDTMAQSANDANRFECRKLLDKLRNHRPGWFRGNKSKLVLG